MARILTPDGHTMAVHPRYNAALIIRLTYRCNHTGQELPGPWFIRSRHLTPKAARRSLNRWTRDILKGSNAIRASLSVVPVHHDS